MERSVNKILMDYTAGEETLENANAALREAGAGFHLEPGRNEITEEERRETVTGDYPQQANGWGLLFTGTGTPDKVEVFRGRLDCPVNEVLPDGSTNSCAQVIICGRAYEVKGVTLVEITEAEDVAKPVQRGPDMRRRTDLAGRQVEQRTSRGRFLVTYDDIGYAVSAKRI